MAYIGIYGPYVISHRPTERLEQLERLELHMLRMLHTDGEHPLQIVSRIYTERYQGFGRCNASHFSNALGDYLCHFVIGFDSDDRCQIVPSGNRIDLADTVDIRDCICDAVNFVPFNCEKNDC